MIRNNEKTKGNNEDEKSKMKKIVNNNESCKNKIENKKEKSKSTIILQLLLLFSISVFIGMLLFDFHSSKVMDSSLSQVVNELDKKIEENQRTSEEQENQNSESVSIENTNAQQYTVTKPINTSVRIGNSTVWGKIKISKIGIEYPIIEYVNDDSLWKSICKISNNSINGTGNLCLAGHNMRNMTMFAKIKNLKTGDTVEITNIYGNKYIYTVYESYYIDPTEVEVLKNTSEPIVTMITCNNTSSKRLIVRAKLQ